MRIVWSRRAALHLTQARAYISQNNPRAAKNIAQAIVAATDRLADFPNSGRPGRIPFSRELVIPGVPFILVYTVDDDRVEILAVIHEARKWPESS